LTSEVLGRVPGPAWPSSSRNRFLRCAARPESALLNHIGNFRRRRAQLRRSLGRVRHAVPKEPVLFTKAPSALSGPNDDGHDPQGSTTNATGSPSARSQSALVRATSAIVRPRPCRRASAWAMTCRSANSSWNGRVQWVNVQGARRPSPARPHGWSRTGRDQGCGRARHVLEVNGQRMQTGREDDVFGVKSSRILHLAIHDPRSGRRHHHRTPPWRRAPA